MHEAAVSGDNGESQSATQTVSHVQQHLAGQPVLDKGNFKPDPAVHVRRMKQFRKLEA
jgi:hypothetical protein